MIRKIGRRGAAIAAVVALASVGVGLSTGVASADGVGYYWLHEHPTGHGVGIYSGPNTESGKVGNDLSSTASSGDGVYLVQWTTGEDLNNQGDVWYQINQVCYGSTGQCPAVAGYVYAAYTDGNWNYDENLLPPYH